MNAARLALQSYGTRRSLATPGGGPHRAVLGVLYLISPLARTEPKSCSREAQPCMGPPGAPGLRSSAGMTLTFIRQKPPAFASATGSKHRGSTAQSLPY